MAGPYVVHEDSFSAAKETAVAQLASGGAFATLTANTHAIEVSEATITTSESNTERQSYMRASSGELPVVVGGRMHDISVTVPARFDGAGTAPEVDALLFAAGLEDSGTNNVYVANSPLPEHSAATVAMTEGDRVRQASGCAFNMVWSGAAGEVSNFVFSGQGLYFPPEQETFSGSYTVDSVAPPTCDNMLFRLTAAEISGSDVSSTFADVDNTLLVNSFSLDLGNTVVPRGTGALRALPNYKVTIDDGAEDATSESNDATADDVSFSGVDTFANDDFIAVGSRFRNFCGIKYNVTTAGVGNTIVAQYYDGSTWSTLNVVNSGVDYTTLGSTGIGYITWDPPSDWAQTTFDSTAAYYIRLSASAAGGTEPLIGQIWSLYPQMMDRAVVANRAPRLTVDFELVDDGTYDIMAEFFKRVTRTVLLQVGASNNNTMQYSMTDAILQAEPVITRNDGIYGVTCVYGAPTADSLTFT